MTKESRSISDYGLQFKSVLLVPEIASRYYKYLEEESATENWDFILDVHRLEELSKKKKQNHIYKQATHIFNTYVRSKSPKEIFMVGEKQKKKIQEEFSNLGKTWDLQVNPSELFKSLKDILLQEYKTHTFKKFSKLPSSLELLEKHKENRNALLPQLSTSYIYKDEDFETMIMGTKDKEFLEKFSLENPNWKLIYTNKKTKSSYFKSYWNYFPDVSFLTDGYFNTNFQMSFDCSLQELACVVFSNYHISDPNVQLAKVIEFKNKEHVIIQQNSVVGAIGALPRTKRTIYTVEYKPEMKQIILKSKTTKIPGVPFLIPQVIEMVVKKGDKPVNTKAVQYFTFSTTILTEVDGKTTFEQFAAVDIGGFGTTDLIVEKRLNALHSGYLKKLSELGERKKIKDFKYEFNELWEGIPVDPLGKLLYDLDIDGKDCEYQKKIEKRNQVFELSNYVVHFGAVNKPDIESEYYKYLQQQKNSDSWDFIVSFYSLFKLQEKNKNEEMKNKLNEIIEQYVLKDSKNSLKLEDNEIQSIADSRDDSSACFLNLRKYYMKIKMKHQFDYFKAFLRTPEASLILAKFQHDKEVMTPIFGYVTHYKEGDFTIPQITENDIQFALDLYQNSITWDQVYSSKNSTISMSKLNLFQSCSFITPSFISFETKYEFNFPIEQVANGYLNLLQLNKTDPNVNKIKPLKFNEESSEYRSSVVLHHDMVWLWKTSFIRENVCTIITNNSQLIYISKPIQPSDGKWFNKHGEFIHYFHYELVILTKNGNDGTTFQQIFCIDSNEKIEWDKKIVERTDSFYPLLQGSISTSPSKITDMRDIYDMKVDEDWKDPLGKILCAQLDRFLEEKHSDVLHFSRLDSFQIQATVF